MIAVVIKARSIAERVEILATGCGADAIADVHHNAPAELLPMP